MKKLMKLGVVAMIISIGICAYAGDSKFNEFDEFRRASIKTVDTSANIPIVNVTNKAKTVSTNVVINGKQIKVSSDQYPLMYQGKTYVPVRLLETLISDVKIEYVDTTKLMIIQNQTNFIVMQLGKEKCCFYGSDILTEQPSFVEGPIVFNSRVYLPLRFAVEKLGYKVLWDAPTRTLSITTDGTAPTISDSTPKTNANESTQKTYYLGGIALNIPSNMSMRDMGNDYVVTDVKDTVGLEIQCSTNKNFKPTFVREDGYGYYGSLTLYKTFGDPKFKIVPLEQQYKDLENILNQMGTKEEVAKVMEKVKADFKIQEDTEMEYINIGDFKLEVMGSRRMAVHESIIVYKK